MLKIKKTKPYQFRKSRRNSTYKTYAGRVVCATALICGIVPSLALLNSYNVIPVSAARKTLSNITTMQEMTTDICNNSALGQSNTLVDVRDGNEYIIKRLEDGNCWMMTNLQLTKEGLITNGQVARLNSETSDVVEGSVFEMPDTIRQLSTETPRDFTDDIDYNGIAQVYNPTTSDIWREGYGAYYNWYAATAGAGNADIEEADTEVTSSICPKSWSLPSRAQYETLLGVIGVNDLETTDEKVQKLSKYFFRAGWVGYHADIDRLDYFKDSGDYWSKTSGSVRNAYELDFYGSGGTVVGDAGMRDAYRWFGYSIRCLAPASSTDFPDRFDEKDVEVIAVRVAPVISIDATSGMKEEADPNKITTGTISATVSANTTYTVQLSANKTSLTNSALVVDTEITSSNSIPASTNVQAKTNAWGILNQDNTTYSAITTNPTTYYNTEEYDEESQATKHTFGVGVSISPTLPAGEYSTTVTITAVNN